MLNYNISYIFLCSDDFDFTYFTTSPKNFENAEIECQSLGTELAYSTDEASAIAMYNTLPENKEIWIGVKLLTVNEDRIFQVIFKK